MQDLQMVRPPENLRVEDPPVESTKPRLSQQLKADLSNFWVQLYLGSVFSLLAFVIIIWFFPHFFIRNTPLRNIIYTSWLSVTTTLTAGVVLSHALSLKRIGKRYPQQQTKKYRPIIVITLGVLVFNSWFMFIEQKRYDIDISLDAKSIQIVSGECTVLNWETSGKDILGVYLNGESIDREGTRRVCPLQTTEYVVTVKTIGDTNSKSLTIWVVPTAEEMGEPPWQGPPWSLLTPTPTQAPVVSSRTDTPVSEVAVTTTTVTGYATSDDEGVTAPSPTGQPPRGTSVIYQLADPGDAPGHVTLYFTVTNISSDPDDDRNGGYTWVSAGQTAEDVTGSFEVDEPGHYVMLLMITDSTDSLMPIEDNTGFYDMIPVASLPQSPASASLVSGPLFHLDTTGNSWSERIELATSKAWMSEHENSVPSTPEDGAPPLVRDVAPTGNFVDDRRLRIDLIVPAVLASTATLINFVNLVRLTVIIIGTLLGRRMNESGS